MPREASGNWQNAWVDQVRLAGGARAVASGHSACRAGGTPTPTLRPGLRASSVVRLLLARRPCQSGKRGALQWAEGWLEPRGRPCEQDGRGDGDGAVRTGRGRPPVRRRGYDHRCCYTTRHVFCSNGRSDDAPARPGSPSRGAQISRRFMGVVPVDPTPAGRR